MQTTQDQIDMAVNAIMDAPSFMDEVALAFRSEKELIHFVEQAKAAGLEHFNSVPYDTMRRQDKPGEKFGVRFEFLRIPNRPWRIEAMAVMDGWAPIHDDYMNKHGSPSVVHLSYKLPDLTAYQEEVRRLMTTHSGKKVAEYANSYGMFSYWQRPEASHVIPYYKPRVNLRDQ